MTDDDDIDALLKDAREWEAGLLASKLDKDIGEFVRRMRRCIERLSGRDETD